MKNFVKSKCKEDEQTHRTESYEHVAKFEYLGTTLTDHNCIQEEIKSRLNSGSACYYAFQSLQVCYLKRIHINNTVISPTLSCGREICFSHYENNAD
jgi:hypothetical protein